MTLTSHAHDSFTCSFILWHQWRVYRDFPLYHPFCERLAFFGTSIFHVKCGCHLPQKERHLLLGTCSNQNPITPWCPTHALEIQSVFTHAKNTSPCWFLQAFTRENYIWDWEYWVVSHGGWARGRVLDEFQTICLFLFFIFYVKSMYLPVPQPTCCCQNDLCASPISRAESHTLPFTVITNILYTKLPSEQGTWQGSAAVSATSQFLNFSFRNGRFQSPELWLFCLTSASLCRGRGGGGQAGSGAGSLWWLFPLFVSGSQGGSRV